MPSKGDERKGSGRALMDRALPVVELAERAGIGAAGSGQDGRYETAGGMAWSPAGLASLRRLHLPDPSLGRAMVTEYSLRSGARSAFVRLGKYATADAMRLRTYVSHQDRWLSLKIWGSGPAGASRARRERETREAVAGIAGYAAPPVLAAGCSAGVHYLLEPVVTGSHPLTRRERREAAVEVALGFLAAYRASGIHQRRLHDVVRPQFGTGLERFLEDETVPWPPGSPKVAVAARMRRLVDEDGLLPCALGHGDLHPHNIVRADDRYWVLDWENGGLRPVAFDLRRLLLSTGDPAGVQRELADDLRAFDGAGPGTYRWSDQLALAMCNELVLTPVRRDRARRFGEFERFDSLLAGALRWLVELLE